MPKEKDEEFDEELLIIDDEDIDEQDEEIFLDQEQTQNQQNKTQNRSYTKYIIIILSLIILLLSILGVYLLTKHEKKQIQEEENSTKIIKNIEKNTILAKPKTKIEKLTQKAKMLYDLGKKEEALKVYAKISAYQKNLSIFNLAVTKIKQKDYQKAIELFKTSANFDDLKFESTLNIAICYKLLGDNNKFKHYLNLANDYIIQKYNSPLFDYYYALIFYYKNRPFESLALLNKYKADFFKYDKNLLLAYQYTLLQNYPQAIKYFSKLKDSNYFFTIGKLYAKEAKYSLAQKAFLNSIKSKKYIQKSLVALSLTQNKLGMFADCSSTLKKIYKSYPKATELFPIKVKLKDSLYDPIKAQKDFKHSIFADIFNKYSLIFYFAPYKLFDPSQSNSIIQKGVKEIYIDNILQATNYLKEASNISQINLKIVQGLELINKHKVYEANKLFKKLTKIYPNHSILHYNLALTYANISDFQKAKKHFQKSFLLDKSNYLAAFFTAFSAILTNQNYDQKVLQDILKHYPTNKYQIKLLYKILNNDPLINFDTKNLHSSFDILLSIIMANISSNLKDYSLFTKKLYKLMPKDLVTNIIYVDNISQNLDIKGYAKNIQSYLTRKSIDYKALFYGETIARELYIKVLSIAGTTRYAKNLLENELKTNPNQIALLQSLAYTYIYTKEYEKAYKIYNNLIDNFNINDPHTLLLASVAAIGANHHANATALLELANLDDRSLHESRFALGLLYQEAKNFEAAAIQFSKIGNIGFKPKYFDFELRKDSN